MRQFHLPSTILTLCAIASVFAAGCNSDSTSSSIVAPAGRVLTVVYDGNTNTGGTPPMDRKSPYMTGSTVTLLDMGDLTKVGYTFAGWNTAADGSGTNYGSSGTFVVATNTRLFAQWSVPAAHVEFMRWIYTTPSLGGPQWRGLIRNSGGLTATSVQVVTRLTCPRNGQTTTTASAVSPVDLPAGSSAACYRPANCGTVSPQVISITWQ